LKRKKTSRRKKKQLFGGKNGGMSQAFKDTFKENSHPSRKRRGPRGLSHRVGQRNELPENQLVSKGIEK